MLLVERLERGFSSWELVLGVYLVNGLDGFAASLRV